MQVPGTNAVIGDRGLVNGGGDSVEILPQGHDMAGGSEQISGRKDGSYHRALGPLVRLLRWAKPCWTLGVVVEENGRRLDKIEESLAKLEAQCVACAPCRPDRPEGL